MKTTPASRRLFLKQASALGTLGAASPLALNLAALAPAAAATATDYKALVCVFLGGGNDHFNTVLATDATSWSRYTAVRMPGGSTSISLLQAGVAANPSAPVSTPAWLGGVLPISPTNAQGRSFALHPSLGGLQTLFDTHKRLAILSNVGTLVEPANRSSYTARSVNLPKQLFSHNDQASQWQSMASEGAKQGWGGRLADAFAASGGQSMFTAVSVAGHSVWLSGKDVRQYNMHPSGAIKFAFSRDSNGIERVNASVLGAATLKRQATTAAYDHVLMKDVAAIHKNSIDAEAVISGAMPGPDDTPYGPSSLLNVALPGKGTAKGDLAQQLQTVARMIAAGQALGVKRQVFFVLLPGFDSHNGQNTKHTELMLQLNHGLVYFDTVLQGMGLLDKVTTFTASDFGRTFTSNGDGTDHGWGAHHFVMGGAVKGGDIHGTFPTYGVKNSNNNDFTGSEQMLYNGVLVPGQSVVQMGATLGKWFGLSPTELQGVFPTLGNFSTTDLGFMKA